MNPSQNSKWYYNLEAAPSCHQQGASTSTSAGDSLMQRMMSTSQTETASSKKGDSPGFITSFAPTISDTFRQLPISTKTALHSLLYNSSSNVGGAVEMGFPNVPLVARPCSMSSVSDLSDPLVQNSQKQMLDNLQCANLLALLGNQFPSFPMQPAAPTQGFPSTCPSPQLLQASNTPFLATLMQQMLCSANAAAPVVPTSPTNNSDLVTQLFAQFLTAQLAQSAQPGPLAGFLQLIQAFGSMGGSTSTATPLQAPLHISILSQLSSLDPATAKQVILKLVNQLVQSGNLTDDETCQRFVKKLQSGPSPSPWTPAQSAASGNWQAVQNVSALSSVSRENVPIAPGNIKKEIISSADKGGREGCWILLDSSASSSPRSTCDVAGVKPVRDATPLAYGIKVDTASEQSAETIHGVSVDENKTHLKTLANGSSGNSRKSAKQTRKSTVNKLSAVYIKDDYGTVDTHLEAVGKDRSKHNLREMDDMDLSERTESSDEYQTSGKRLRRRSKPVKYCEDELPDWMEQSDNETSSKKKKLHSRVHSNSQNSSAETKTNRSISGGLTQSSGILENVSSCGNARNELNKGVLKTEVTEPISILPNVNICHSPNVRYLFMGRKSDGMDWLSLVSYKTADSDDFMNQCLFCPMTSSEVKPVTDHLASEHSDLDFVLTNIKQPTGKVIYLACRHCNFVTFEPTLIWIHFELYHGIPGIMDGSSLPQITIGDPVNVEEISLDEPVNSRKRLPAYICLDCILCSNNSNDIAMHVVQAHPDTVNFNGCFVKLMMIKTKEKDCFTFREAMYDESHADALKDLYVCMLCEYSTHCAYLAMSHSLRLHQTKRLLFVCKECDYHCTREASLMVHVASSHQYSGISSFMCSVTLIATLSDGTFIECTLPAKCLKTSDHSNSNSVCDMRSCSILQSTAVSSSQEKRKLNLVTQHEESTVAPQS